MYRAFLAALALAAVPLATLVPSATSTPAPAGPPGPGAVVGMHIQLFRAIDGADPEKAASFVGPAADASLFLARTGQPEVARGREQVVGQLEAWARDSEPGQFSTAITPLSADCASGDLSYAVLEIERSQASTKGQPLVAERYLSTSLVQYRDGGWKLLHWHLSPAPAR